MESDADLDSIAPADTGEPSLQLTIDPNEMSACVQQYLADLPDNYRTVILLRDMHGMTRLEIAETLGLSLSTVKIRLHRARRKLQETLDTGCTFSHDAREVLVCEPKP